MNARILVSRNKREGEYCGHERYLRDSPFPSPRHARVGKTNIVSLREWKRRER